MTDIDIHVKELGPKINYAYSLGRIAYLQAQNKGPVPIGSDRLLPDEFMKVLRSFFEYTLEPMVYGNLKKKDGTYWDSSRQAFDAWVLQNNLDYDHARIFLKAVNDVEPYT